MPELMFGTHIKFVVVRALKDVGSTPEKPFWERSLHPSFFVIQCQETTGRCHSSVHGYTLRDINTHPKSPNNDGKQRFCWHFMRGRLTMFEWKWGYGTCREGRKRNRLTSDSYTIRWVIQDLDRKWAIESLREFACTTPTWGRWQHVGL